jgi:hypothetical protein
VSVTVCVSVCVFLCWSRPKLGSCQTLETWSKILSPCFGTLAREWANHCHAPMRGSWWYRYMTQLQFVTPSKLGSINSYMPAVNFYPYVCWRWQSDELIIFIVRWEGLLIWWTRLHPHEHSDIYNVVLFYQRFVHFRNYALTCNFGHFAKDIGLSDNYKLPVVWFSTSYVILEKMCFVFTWFPYKPIQGHLHILIPFLACTHNNKKQHLVKDHFHPSRRPSL